MRYWMIFAILGSILCSVAIAAGGELSGRVVDRDTRELMEGVNVVVGKTGRGGATDDRGAFRITGLPEGRHAVRLSFVGYLTAVESIEVGAESAQLEVALTPTVLEGQAVTVTATRAVERETPVSFSNIDRGHIERTLTAADVPSMLNELPSVHTWSLAGNGIGYTYLSIRGFPQERIAVTVNGIPLNDPETHMVYWVNMPDLMESVEDIQVQRGVGTSPYGAAAIGGSVNLVTGTFRQTEGITLTGVAGSYDSRKFSAEFNSGTVADRYQMYGRFSRITSDGYRDQGWSDLWSYYFGAVRQGKNSRLRFNFFGGTEKTHYAFYGATKEQLAKNRKANPFSPYEDATDNFTQPHYQLIHEWQPADDWMVSNAVYTIKGDGFYKDQHWNENFIPVAAIRRDLLDITQYGWIPRVEWTHAQGTLTVGGELRTNGNHHWGEVLGIEMEEGETVGSIRSGRLYDFEVRKTTLGLYVHERYRPLGNLSIEAHLSAVGHVFDIGDERAFAAERIEDFSYFFLMPRLGINYNLSEAFNLFANFSVGRREPGLTNIFDPPAFFGDADRRQAFTEYDAATNRLREPRLEAERLNNWELGVGYVQPRWLVKGNLYRMDFSDEIVATGQVLGTGSFDHENAARSVHQGIELSASVRPASVLTVSGNASFSENSLEEFGDGSLDGNDIPNFPERLANLRVTYQRGELWGSMRLRHVGGYFFDLQNTPGNEVEAFTTASLRLSYRIEDAWDARVVEPSFEIENLFDAEYETWGGLFFGTPTWIGGAGRNFLFSIRVTL
jgi:iron complex outermembrane recepter protein